MPHLTAQQAKEVSQWLNWFRQVFQDSDGESIRIAVVNSHELPEIRATFDNLARLAEALDREPVDGLVELEPTLVPVLKRVIVSVRRNEARRIEYDRERARHPDVLAALERRIEPIESLLGQDWLRSVDPMRMPRLTDYLPVKLVEEKPWGPSQLQDRVYDEKFGILQAPLQLFTDMEFYRRRCAIRGRGVVVAYLDIDKFKDFNRAYLETKVDHLVLPRFMEAVEAHVYAHGFAYRYGGDEYALLLPNMDAELAAAFLNQLRRKVGEVEYPGTDKRTTVSIGFVLVGPDSHLTDREALRLANQAKNHAKQGGRDRLATYAGDLFREEDLRLLNRKGSAASRRPRRS